MLAMMLFLRQGYCSLSDNINSSLPGALHATPHGNAVVSTKKEQISHQEAVLSRANLQEAVVNANSSNGRVMLIDGTSVIYRAYYKLLGNSNCSYFLLSVKCLYFHHIESNVLFCFLLSAASLRCFFVAACFCYWCQLVYFLSIHETKKKKLCISCFIKSVCL